jgi:hypothetical protein
VLIVVQGFHHQGWKVGTVDKTPRIGRGKGLLTIEDSDLSSLKGLKLANDLVDFLL